MEIRTIIAEMKKNKGKFGKDFKNWSQLVSTCKKELVYTEENKCRK